MDLADGLGLRREVLEEGRFSQVRGFRIPGIDSLLAALDRVPGLVAAEHGRVPVVELVGRDRRVDRLLDFRLGRPNVPQEDRVSFLAHP